MIELQSVSKSYDGTTRVLDKVDLSIDAGEFITLLGPSGCGKTTLLKIINKLVSFDGGDVLVRGKSISQWNTTELRRSIGYVVQQIGLFPHLTIEDNISYVMSLLGEQKAERRKRAAELIQLVGMDEHVLGSYPRELSGGQKQRIGVARALAADPDIVIMDEPFGAVDEITRAGLQEELKHIQESLHKTILFVTHDIEEALRLGSRVLLLNNGRIEQFGTKEELLFAPASDFVKEFLGLKGFKSLFDDAFMADVYDRVRSNDVSMEELYARLLV